MTYSLCRRAPFRQDAGRPDVLYRASRAWRCKKHVFHKYPAHAVSQTQALFYLRRRAPSGRQTSRQKLLPNGVLVHIINYWFAHWRLPCKPGCCVCSGNDGCQPTTPTPTQRAIKCEIISLVNYYTRTSHTYAHARAGAFMFFTRVLKRRIEKHYLYHNIDGAHRN